MTPTQNDQDTLREKVERLPRDPGVYLFKDESGNMLYVGKAKDLRTRVRSYLRASGDGRYHVQFLINRAHDIDFMITATEQEALILENNLIKKYRPRYNVVLKDDKTYVHLRLNVSHDYPRLTVVRRPKRDGARYFGPFASAGSVRSTLRTLGRVFPMRTCTDAELVRRTRPCLYYHIKRCPGPCVGKIDPQDYNETVTRVTMFLKGRGDQLLKKLRDKMALQSAERQYEAAGRTRDQVFAVQRVLERQRISSPQAAQRDVFAVYRERDRMAIQVLTVRGGEVSDGHSFLFRNVVMESAEHLASFVSQYYQQGAPVAQEVVVSEELGDTEALEALLAERAKRKVAVVQPQRGERRQLIELATQNAMAALKDDGASERNQSLLEDLQDLLELTQFPRRIECFDISNIQGTDAVASGVCFIDGEPSRNQYRRFKIRTVKGANDYGMMREVLERRVARGAKEGDLPDLLVVDGGRGQLNVAVDVLKRLGHEEVDTIGIAKVRDEKQRKQKGRERIYLPNTGDPLLLEGNVPALFLLERIRDEAHRFAITYHKKTRSKKLKRSELDNIPGVGTVLKQRLLTEFGSVARIKKASAEVIAMVPGVSLRLAETIKAALR